jgi:hypothetical protein
VNTSPTIKELAIALHKAQKNIKAALKDSTNPHFRSKYADLSSVIDAVKQPLLDQGIIFSQGISGVENGVAVETMLLHISGEWMSSTLEIPATKHDAQGYGSAITYGRRYGLQSMCGVPAEDDDGNAATAPQQRFAINEKVVAEFSKNITPVAGSLAALSSIEQELARGIAAEIVDEWQKGNEVAAYELFYEGGHSNEFKLGIWECLQPNSKVRNGNKKISEANKQKAA